MLRQLQSFASVVIVIAACFYSCSPKNSDSGKAIAENLTTPASIPAFKDVDPIVKSQLAIFLTGYLAINHALIVDSLATSKAAAAALLETAKKFEMSKLTGEQMDFYFMQSSKLKAGLQEISSCNGIENARYSLASVSESMYALVKAFHPQDSALYYQYCPMARSNKGANWLSATEELVNPYMGQIMLECGRTQEKLE